MTYCHMGKLGCRVNPAALQAWSARFSESRFEEQMRLLLPADQPAHAYPTARPVEV